MKPKVQLKFVLGDRVRVIGYDGFEDCHELSGKLGTIVISHHTEGGWVGVQFDEAFSQGHNCSGNPPNYPRFEHNKCRWGSVDDLEFIEHGPMIEPVGYDFIEQKKGGVK